MKRVSVGLLIYGFCVRFNPHSQNTSHPSSAMPAQISETPASVHPPIHFHGISIPNVRIMQPKRQHLKLWAVQELDYEVQGFFEGRGE